MRLFVAVDGVSDEVTELTDGDQQIVRVAAADLQQARRVRARIRAGVDNADDVAVVLDVIVAVGDDFRAARRSLDPGAGANAQTLHYVGTVDGLAGLISDIGSADVADGVTLIPASPRQDVGTLGRDVLGRLTRAS